jgi:hypothetical protein
MMPEKGTLPPDVPSYPNRTYCKKGWAGMGDWLGTGTIPTQRRKYRSFDDARSFARSLNLRGNSEWRKFCKGNMPIKGNLPPDVPANPNITYAAEGWAGYGDWLGTGNVANHLRMYRSFTEARDHARGLDLHGQSEWNEFCKGNHPGKGMLPADIPTNPDKFYKNQGWLGMGDWLGTGNISNGLRKYRSFQDARSFARSLDLKDNSEWRKFCKGNMPSKGHLPSDIPASGP